MWSGYVRIRQHSSGYVRIREHTSHLVALDVVARPMPLGFDGVVVNAQHVCRQQERLEVPVCDIVDAGHVDLALGRPEDVLFAVRKL